MAATGDDYGEALRPILDTARAEAARLGHDFVGTEHLLLGVLKAPDPSLRQTLERLKVNAAAVTERLHGAIQPGQATLLPADLPLRSGARKALGLAAREARSLGESPVGPGHLMVALLRERRGVAYQALVDSGAGLDGGRKERSEPARAPVPKRGRKGGAQLAQEAPVPAVAPAPAPRLRQKRGLPGLRPLLLVAVPASWALAGWHAAPTLVFAVACIAVLPLAGYMGEATEHLAHRTGPAIGGLLNATFGNAAELVIAIVALRAGLVELVKASITGSILGNLLLILGLSLLFGGLERPVLRFNRSAAGMSAVMLALSVVGLVFPALFHSMHPEELARRTELRMSEVVAAVLGVTYLLSLLFSLKTHKSLFGGEAHPLEGRPWSLGRAIGVLGLATTAVAVESELLVHATESVTATLGLSQLFLGLIVIPLIGNAAEHATAVLVARKGQLDLALQIALGSSTQVALFVAPLLVLVGLFLGTGMDLVFTPFEVAAVGLATLVVALITLDGESHWFEGLQLLSVYTLVAAAGFFI